MDYQQSRAYVKDADRYAGGALDLTNIKELMKRLGNPQDQLKYVHVAGTNGKGSVIAYLYTTLSEAGYRVGRYISPSVYSYREKMEVAGSAVSREQFAGYVTRVAAAIKEMITEGLAHPTPFEIETAVAFLFFAEIDAIGENRGYTFCDSATFGSKERFYTLKIDNKDVTWYNK